MRKFIAATVIVIGLLSMYLGSIALSTRDLLQAVRSGDSNRILAQTDLPRLRRSITDQVLDAYLEKTGKDQKPLTRMLASTYGASVADAMLSRFLTPENLTKLLQTGSASDEALGLTLTMPALDRLDASRLLDLVGRVRPIQPKLVALRISDTDELETYLAIELHLEGATWKLAGLALPPPVTAKLAQALPRR